MSNMKPQSLAAQLASSETSVPPQLAAVLNACGQASAELALLVSLPAAIDRDRPTNRNSDGDIQQPLDIEAHNIFVEALSSAPVKLVLSEEAAEVITLADDGEYLVAFDPLDGSSNIKINAPIGTIFSVLPAADVNAANPESAFLRNGDGICAAGCVLYGPSTVMALSTGSGVDLYILDWPSGSFVYTGKLDQMPSDSSEFAVNSSNYRHWDERFRSYIDDLVAGEAGPRGRDFNMRWTAALVAEAYRIMLRGGIFMYPADERPGYEFGRLRLLYEAHPIAYLIEQAGGSATDGEVRMLDRVATALHERTPFIFGSPSKVAKLDEYWDGKPVSAERMPLFGQRGLYRS